MLLRRVITALILAPLFLAGLFMLPPVGFSLFVGVVLLLAAWEWAGLCDLQRTGRLVAMGLAGLAAAALFTFELRFEAAVLGTLWWTLAFAAVVLFPKGREIWERPASRMLAGIFMLLPAWAGLTLLQEQPGGPWLVLWAMVVVWAADIGAYFAGHAFGKRKLAPAVSPGKTWEGAIGGGILALVLSVAMAWSAGISAWVWVVLLSIDLIGVSIIGDLTESLVKRVAGVKDSGSLLPGHGGILDRVDAVLSAAPVAAVALIWFEVVPAGMLAQWWP